MYQVFKSKKVLFFFIVLCFFVLANKSYADDICDRCHKEIKGSTYYPAVIVPGFNQDKMVIKYTLQEGCEHIFCGKCSFELNKPNKDDFSEDMYWEKAYFYCPYCYSDYNKIVSVDDNISFEKNINEASDDELEDLFYELLYQGDLDKALCFINSILSKASLEGEEGRSYCSYIEEEKNNFFIILAKEYIEKGMSEQALGILDNSIDLSNISMKDDFDNMSLFVNLANLYVKLNQGDKALVYLEKSLQLTEDVELDQNSRVRYNYLVSYIYSKLHKKNDALIYVDKVLYSASSIEHPYERATCLGALSLICIDANSKEKALNLLQEIVKIADSSEDEVVKQFSFFPAIKGYLELNKIEISLELLNKSLQSDTAYLTKDELVFINQFNNYIDLRRFDLAIELLDNSKNLADSILFIPKNSIYKNIVLELLDACHRYPAAQ